MKLPSGEKSGQLAASPQRFDSLSPLAIHAPLLSEAAARFSQGREFLWLYGRPWAQQGPPCPSPAAARPSHRSCRASRGGHRAWARQRCPSRATWPESIRALQLPLAHALPWARLVEALYPPLICPHSHLSPLFKDGLCFLSGSSFGARRALLPGRAGHKAKPTAPCPALCVEKQAWGGAVAVC